MEGIGSENLPHIILISIASAQSKSNMLLELLHKLEGDNFNPDTN